MSTIEHLITFNSLIVFIGTALLGAACGAIGAFTVLRERALLGDCVAHASLPGVCTAFILFQERSFFYLFTGAVVAGLLSAWCLSVIKTHSRIKEDAAIALVLSCFFGLGIALSRHIQNSPSGSIAGIDSFIFGKAATMSISDVTTIGIVAALTIGVTLALYKELTLLCFDREFAATQGYPVRALDLILMILVCLCTTAGLPAVGAVLVVALLIIPAVTARLWSDSLSVVVVISALIGAASSMIGVIISALIPRTITPDGLPTGPVIVLSAASLFVISYISAPRHGLLYRARMTRGNT